MRIDITLRGDDAEWFEDRRETAGERRNGNEPNRAEYLRLLLEDSDI